MRTLDEVIKAMEMCTTCPEDDEMCPGCPYADEQGNPECLGQDKEDALHYLKEYQRYQNTPSRMVRMAMCDENNPLTWDELKQMLGKPVCVEHKYYNKWLIVYEVYENTIVLDGNGWYTQYFSDDNDKEVRWKAYRRER